MNYNLTKLQEANTIPEFIGVVNSYANDSLVGFFLIGIFFTLLMIMKRYEFDNSLMVSSFLCFMFSLFLKYLGWINFKFVLVFLIVMALSMFYSFLLKR